MIKLCRTLLLESFRYPITKGQFQCKWKKANLVPVHKG